MLVLGLGGSVRVRGLGLGLRFGLWSELETPGYETSGYEKVRIRKV